MEELEPRLKNKILTKEVIGKYIYVFVLAVILIGGISYGYTFFIQNDKVASGSITTAALTINFTDRSISASNLSVPTDDQDGMSEFSKSLTITNQTAVNGKVKLTLTRTSGLNLTDLRYALVVNGAIQEIDDVPSDGEILSSAIMGNETVNVEVKLWPKTSYSGSETTFVGELTPEIKYLGQTAASIDSPAGKYVNFNCSGNTCEVWQIVKVEDNRLVLTKQANYSGATERTNSNKYNPTSFNPAITFNDDSMITSLSTDGLNVYLAKTVKISGGSGTQADPYTLINNDFREPDKKVIAVITYKDDNNTTVGTQNVYYNETNYISQVIDDSNFQGWTDGTNNYDLGDTVSFTTNTSLTAITVQTLKNRIQTLCDDSSIAYVQKYDATQNGAVVDTPDGSGNEDVCYYTTTSSNRNSDAEQNGNVIFGDFCWQIVRTTTDGGVKLVYNGLKTNSGKCTSDAADNYNSDPRPASIGVVGTNGKKTTPISGSKKYGTSYEIFTDTNDNNTNKFRLKNVSELSWSDSTYKDLIGKYVCGTSSSPTGTDETCTVLYYIGHYQSNTEASTEKYTIGTNAHYSQIGTSSYNAYSDSPALVGYMYNDVYNVKNKSFSSFSNSILNQKYMSNTTAYYYGDDVSWDGTDYNLIDTGTGVAPTATSTWTDIRGSVGGKYTCQSNNATTGKKCKDVYYVVADSSDNYMYSVKLSNNETKDNQVTWKYGTGITKTGNTYMLMDGNNESALTKTFKLRDWYTGYSDSSYKNIYVCSDFTSTTCETVYYISDTDNCQIKYYILNYTYYFASDINYDSTTNTYSYDTNGTIQEVYDWYHQYNILNNTHYMCETYNPSTHNCEANKPIYYIDYTSNNEMYYATLNGVSNISQALINMLSKDTIENNQVVTVNKYNSSIKGVIDSWYMQNIEDNNLTSYLDDNSVYCYNRTITNYGSWSENGSTTSNYGVYFIFHTNDETLGCSNVTDRFSVNNNKAKLSYPIGLLSTNERNMMFDGFARTGQSWWLGTANYFYNDYVRGHVVYTSGSRSQLIGSYVSGVRPAIVLKPGVEISSGDGTYNTPYVIDTIGS